jgi:Fe-S-cluster containining protein
MTDVCAAHGCSACCHETEMPLTEEDARRLEALGHARAAFSRTLDGALTLANVSGACYFLKDGRCSVYDERPAGCRLYPFVLTPEGRMVRDEDCPWRREFREAPGTRRRLLRVVAVVERERARDNV